MNNTNKVFGIIALVLIFILSSATCFGQTLNNAQDLKKYLDSQPANSPNNPINITMTINDPMLGSVVSAINSASKYVSLNISGNILTAIGGFGYCTILTSVTIPNSVTSIGDYTFGGCIKLTSVTIGNGVTGISIVAFKGDLSEKYFASNGGPGTYKAKISDGYWKEYTWTKQ